LSIGIPGRSERLRIDYANDFIAESTGLGMHRAALPAFIRPSSSGGRKIAEIAQQTGSAPSQALSDPDRGRI
jgi:hypothetical protein